ncbi:glycosyl hydrolase [Paenibacillus hunanensis]|uniref:glycosyl hydrolase n=1 Tax=Paenibacillus hunanensis TaxID=539262 RepID=UPI002A6995E4|nr:glycosyl hydrolase [Paenibacillus hunanensis]WPP43237.1 glycosyl hydrolase [Paenibacillus hunanensis]
MEHRTTTGHTHTEPSQEQTRSHDRPVFQIHSSVSSAHVEQRDRNPRRMDTDRLYAAELYDRLLDPLAEYRAIPFWSWNDRMEPEEIRRQVREMKQAGLGGYIMHARAGLETPYMGDEWMDCIAAGIDEGHKLGMRVWCYDENGWPSGFADGVVPALGLDYQQKWLKLERLQTKEVNSGVNPSADEDFSTIAWYRWQDGHYVQLPSEQRHVAELRLYYDINPYYIDTLDANVVRAFIESTYERYADRFAEHFGQAVAGIFTDEPQYGRNQVPWSFTLQQRYQEAYGMDLLQDLPLLFLEGTGHEEIRYRFWQLATQLFSQSFMQQIGDWCQEKNIRLTGHVVCEDHLTAQTGAVGDAMASYEYMQVPGIDWLGRFIDNPITPKQVSSVAHQLGQKFVLSETFGCSGWNVSFADLKWIAEWQYVHGINLMCQHLQGYSLRGIRKRDYPPSLYYQQPWWSQYHQFNDYFGRLSMLMAESTVEADILLLHPIRSSWLVYTHPVEGADEAIARGTQLGVERGERINQDFVQISEWLGALHYGHDYGSESIIEHHGRIEGKQLVIGQAAYGTVILPPMLTIGSTTLELLLRFSEQGGRILALGALPEMVDGKPDERLSELELRTPCLPLELSAVQQYVREHVPASIILHQIEYSSERSKAIANLTEPTALIELNPVTQSPLLSRIHTVQVASAEQADQRHPASLENENIVAEVGVSSDTLNMQPDRLVYIVNTDREQGYHAIFELSSFGDGNQAQVDYINLENGTIQPLNILLNAQEQLHIELDFAPAQSYMLRVSEATSPAEHRSIDSTEVREAQHESQSTSWSEHESNSPIQQHVQANRSTDDQATGIVSGLHGSTTSAAPSSAVMMPAQDWAVKLSDPNSITLDRCRWRIADGEWSAPEPIIFVQQHLIKIGHPVDVELEFTVEAAAGDYLQREMFLALEEPQRYKISINDQPLEQQELGWWRDIAFRKLDIRGLLHEGQNRIVLAGHFANSEATYEAAARAAAFESEGNKLFYDTELESIYILGHFAVQSMTEYTYEGVDAIYTEGPFQLLEPQDTARTGDLTTEGLLFYAGNVQLTRPLLVTELQPHERVWLVCERPHAVLSRVFMNGQECSTWMWAPYEADITDWLQQGENELTIELLSSCRNLLGPHHHVRGELTMVGPDSFTDQPSWTDGNFDGDSIYVDRYCMVRFGLASEPQLVIRSS